MSQNQEILAKVLDALKTKVSDFNYKNWFKNLSWVYEDDNTALIKVPTKFVRDWLTDHYVELIKFEFFRLTEKEHKIIFKIDKNLSNNLELFPKPQETTTPDSGKTEVGVKPEAKEPIKKNAPVRLAHHLGFNPKYEFDGYVVGNSNQLVFAACQAVAAQPAKNYNPLFIYGGVGLGKTHLLNAIGLEIIKHYRDWRIISCTGERFTNEVISAIRYGKTYELRKKYRENCDMLLIDDIQFIAGKERTMEEFFHTFNALYEARKQIVLTSDQLPREIDKLEERLKSRFGWGLLADIQTPDYETRMAILRKKSEEYPLTLPDEVCEFIAAHVTDNVRDLEGSLIRVSAFASLAKLPITLNLAKEVLKDVIPNMRPLVTVESIQSKVADYYQLKIADLKSKRRHRALATPRQIAMYLCKTHLEVSFPELGQKFGGKDHTTVMHAVQKIKNSLPQNAGLQSEVDALTKKLGV